MVNKQGERTKKTAIKYFWPFGRFRIEGQKQQNSDFQKDRKDKIQSRSFSHADQVSVGYYCGFQPVSTFEFSIELSKQEQTLLHF